MAQPDYVPQVAAPPILIDVPPPPARWQATRPADISDRAPSGARLGAQGPDQGYGLKLARRFVKQLLLTANESAPDAVAGCLGVGLKRASVFHRAPVIWDMELAFGAWGFLDRAPDELVAFRRPLFQGASHHYWDQRAIADLVPAETLRLAPADARARLGEWRSLLRASP